MIDDDEDDFEGYFLRPANEYNIKEKIKLANQESFAIPTPPSPKFLAGERRVTFRDQLVDYEPDDYSAGEEEEPDENGGSGSGNFRAVNGYMRQRLHLRQLFSCVSGVLLEESESSPELNDRSQSKATNGAMDEVDEDIIEELSINDATEEEIESRVRTTVEDDDDPGEEDYEQGEEDEEEVEPDGEDGELEEEVTESSLDTEIHNPETLSEDSSSPTKARASGEGSGSGEGQEVNYSEDSQGDEDNSEERAILKEQLMRESLSYDQEDATEDQDEDQDGRDSPVPSHLKNRSAKCQRQCCRHKQKIVNERLPYYNGYHSEYGLSKKELDLKQKRVEAKKKRFQERHQKKVEQQQIKAQTNEEAFATWLNKKLKSSINKYQNMYDYKGKKHKRRVSNDDSIMGVTVN
ncbi:uncharacterized protein LOC128093279 isoform X1 [Culex pipiens pallens]|uniref:uncharacterized protein LOC128093279 isoform X1 n=1 Tax=Culex pipiens pallens TaxID=42434 RepID=UPI0022AA10C5|nr:uncharacterized protein LOC128093279 isoform X1 [Culex pipiens pallens]